MNEDKAITLAEIIIELDLLRDELYEELVTITGNRASEILRVVQNT